MKPVCYLSCAILSLAFTSTAALAGGSLKDGPYNVPYIWSGFYVGAQVGYEWGDADHSFSNGAPSDTSSPDGIVGGGHLGYNFQTGNVVFGIEADFEGADVDDNFVNLSGATSQGGVRLSSQGSVRGRLGFVSGQGLYYVTGGYAFGNFDFKGGPAFIVPTCCGYDDTLSGWTAGAGGEWQIGHNLTARLEYRYTDFGSTSGGLAPVFPGVTMSVDDITTHAVRAGISYHFSGY